MSFTGNVLQWMRSFRELRSPGVRLQDEFLRLKPVKSGMPHASVLGPIVFVVFVNDILEVVENHSELFSNDAKQDESMRIYIVVLVV